MVRKQLYIHRYQDALLKKRAKDFKVTEAELVRRAIDQVSASAILDQVRDAAGWEEEREFIKQLMKDDAAKGKRVWRRDELYER